MKVTDIPTHVPIMEVLNTHTPIQWTQIGNNRLLGTGQIDEVQLQLIIDAISYKQYNGYNLAFTTEQDGQPIETFRNEFGVQSSKIIGAVVNGLAAKLDEYEFSFGCLAAKDNVEKRASLYSLVANRFAKKLHVHINTYDHDGSKLVVLIKHDVPLAVIVELENSLK
jgi:hypothetical protein